MKIGCMSVRPSNKSKFHDIYGSTVEGSPTETPLVADPVAGATDPHAPHGLACDCMRATTLMTNNKTLAFHRTSIHNLHRLVGEIIIPYLFQNIPERLFHRVFQIKVLFIPKYIPYSKLFRPKAYRHQSSERAPFLVMLQIQNSLKVHWIETPPKLVVGSSRIAELNSISISLEMGWANVCPLKRGLHLFHLMLLQLSSTILSKLSSAAGVFSFISSRILMQSSFLFEAFDALSSRSNGAFCLL
jgi:hypothetical protein